MTAPLLELSGISMEYRSERGRVRALDEIDLTVREGETLGLVGESGCGKTTLARIALGTLHPTGGRVLMDGDSVASTEGDRRRNLRRQVQMVFQNPYSSIDPRFTVLRTVAEPFRTHTDLRGGALKEQVRRLLDQVGIPADLLVRYAHELSGGQLQRVAFARAIALEPRLLVLDEPTSSLDVSVQAQILNLLKTLRQTRGLTYLFISHDLGVIRHLADRVAVMYRGRVVEIGSAEEIFSGQARHPYTELLLASMPAFEHLGRRRHAGDPAGPEPPDPERGCVFSPRCPYTADRCLVETPRLDSTGTGHPVACHAVNAGG